MFCIVYTYQLHNMHFYIRVLLNTGVTKKDITAIKTKRQLKSTCFSICANRHCLNVNNMSIEFATMKTFFGWNN